MGKGSYGVVPEILSHNLRRVANTMRDTTPAIQSAATGKSICLMGAEGTASVISSEDYSTKPKV